MKNNTHKVKSLIIKGSAVNLCLSAGKLTAGITANSQAMVADALHSLSDLFTDIIVYIFTDISNAKVDEDHHYGHGKYLTLATLAIGAILMLAGGGILINGFDKIIRVINNGFIQKPGIIALYAAFISFVVKELLFHYTVIKGKYLNNRAIIANAWHHRTDAFSSAGGALGIAGAIFLGENYRILDPIAGIFISFFIIRIGWKIAGQNIRELLETALPEKTQKEIMQIIKNTDGVIDYHNLKTRSIGDSIALDVHIEVKRDLTVESSHQIATAIEKSIKEHFEYISHIGIHIEPFKS